MKTLANALLLVWFALYELIFAAVAILSGLNPYVLAAIFVIGNGCNIICAQMNKLSPYERPMMYNSEIFTTALCGIGVFSYLAVGVCFFVDWKIALAALGCGLILGSFLTFVTNALVVIPLFSIYRGLLKIGEKAQ